MFPNKFLLLLIINVASVYSYASSNDKCTTVYPFKGERILPSSTVSLGDQISLKLDVHQLPVLVVGQLREGGLHIDWLNLSTKEMGLIIYVGVGNSLKGEEVMSGFKAKKQVQSETEHVIVDLTTAYCNYDYALFKICTYVESELSDDEGVCNPTQMVLVERENKRDTRIIARKTFEDNVELELNPDISNEKNKLHFLECVVKSVDNQEDKLESYEIQYYKKTSLNFVVAHKSSDNSNHMCLLLVSSPNYYQLYSTDIISFSKGSIGKGEHRSINNTEEGLENGNRFIRGMPLGRNLAMKRRVRTLRKYTMDTNKYVKKDYERVLERKIQDLTKEITEKVSNWARKYLRNLKIQDQYKKHFRKGRKKHYKKMERT